MNDHRSRVLAVLATAVLAAVAAAQGVPNPDLDLVHHVLRRSTCGPTKALVAQLTDPIGSTPLQKVQAYIQEQLNPSAASDPFWPYGSQAVQQMVPPGGVLNLPAAVGGTALKVSVDSAQLAYGLDSKWQLREVMGQFWDRHFNTGLFTQKAYFSALPYGGTVDDYVWFFEWQANDWYRQNALTTFDELLKFTAKHVTMEVYLSMVHNVAPVPNEDFARELLELYTVSPEMPQAGGATIQNYDQSDIEKVARVLTGWSVDPANQYAFVFNDSDHVYSPTPTTLFMVSGSPITLPLVVSPNGEAEGLRLFRALAGRVATSHFVCQKMINYFIAEEAPGAFATLLANMKVAWGPLGDIKAVLSVLLTSNEFLGTTNHLRKARIPLEAVLAQARGMSGTIPIDPGTSLPVPTCFWNSDIALIAMGQPLLAYPAPNGFPTANAAQMSPSVALERVKLANTDLFVVSPQNLAFDVVALVQSQLQPAQYQNFVAVNRVLLKTLYGSNWSQADEVALASVMAGVVAYINTLGTGAFAPPFDPNNPNHYWAVLSAAAVTAMGMTQSGLR